MEQQELVVYGATWCKDCKRTKQFLGSHHIPYRWVNIYEQPDALAFVEQVNNGSRSVPTIIFPDQTILVEPSNAEMAEKLGLRTRAAHQHYDAIIIGGGPAGLTAATYTSREGLNTLVIEKSALGGQVSTSQQLDNAPGFDEGISGEELAHKFAHQAQRFGAETLEAQQVTDIMSEDNIVTIHTASGDRYTAKAVLVATGSHYRRLGVPGEEELVGMSVHFCATCDGAFYKGKDVLVVGGGNSGIEESLFLAEFVKSLTIVEFLPTLKASAYLQRKLADHDNIRVITNHSVKAFNRTEDNHIASVQVENRATGESLELHPDGAFVFVGLSPNTSFLPQTIDRDQWGFLTTDQHLMTSLPGVFAAGDVRAGSTKQVASAAGEGATAALAMRQYIDLLNQPTSMQPVSTVLA